MNWKFWRNLKKKNRRPITQPLVEHGAPGTGASADRSTRGGLRMSGAELVSLQRLIGNQAVIRILKGH